VSSPTFGTSTVSSWNAVPTADNVPAGNDVLRLVARIAAVTGVNEHEVLRRLRSEYDSLGSTSRRDLVANDVPPHVWSEGMLRFYAETDAFFYELVVWNGSGEKEKMRHWIADFLARHAPTATSLLLYGDGLGFDGAFLRRAGHQVTCFDVSPRYKAFATGVFVDAGVDVEWIDDDMHLDGRRFDVIVCLDVLEHVPEPWQLVERLNSLLSPGGLLVVHAPFWRVDDVTPTHLRENQRLSGTTHRLFGSCGLKPIDGRWMWNPVVLGHRDARIRGVSRMAAVRVTLASWLLRAAGMAPWPFNAVVRWMLQRDAHRRLLGIPEHLPATKSTPHARHP
jgi:SAM-dependent methyltransferase